MKAAPPIVAAVEDGSHWPTTGADGLEWRLRHGEPSRADLLRAASIICGYRALIWADRRRREMVVRSLRRIEDGRT